MTKSHPRSQNGFTLLELMLTITVAAVVLGLAIPNVMQFAANNRLSGAANDLLAAIYAARTEAIKRRVPTAMCFTTTPTATTPACDGTGKEGWVTWVDTDSDFVVDAANEPILVRHLALSSTVTVKLFPGGTSPYMGYLPTGFLRDSPTDFSGVVACDKRGAGASYSGGPSYARGLLISTTGRPAVTRDAATISGASLLNGGACP